MSSPPTKPAEAADALLTLIGIMARLRTPVTGCPALSVKVAPSILPSPSKMAVMRS